MHLVMIKIDESRRRTVIVAKLHFCCVIFFRGFLVLVFFGAGKNGILAGVIEMVPKMPIVLLTKTETKTLGSVAF